MPKPTWKPATATPPTAARCAAPSIGSAARTAVDAEVRLYDKLFTEANMNGIPGWRDFKDYLNPDSVQVH